jgi:glycosyltransferase 2 family protein
MRGLKWLSKLLVWGIVAVLLWIAFRSISLDQLRVALNGLRSVEIALLLLANFGVVILMGARWWFFLRMRSLSISLIQTSIYRLASFAVSYFTPGPQFGGEPLQVILLSGRHEMGAPAAAATVAAEKAIELLANFLFLLIGSGLLLGREIFPSIAPIWWGLMWMLPGIPLVYLIAIWRGSKPAASILARVPQTLNNRFDGLQRASRFLTNTEVQMQAIIIDQPGGFIGALGISVLIWAALIGEYWLALNFLGISLDLADTIVVMTAARFAFLTPLPGGLGALEAGQIFIFSQLGFPPGIGAAVALLIRARDVLFGAIGLLVGGLLVNRLPRNTEPE